MTSQVQKNPEDTPQAFIYTIFEHYFRQIKANKLGHKDEFLHFLMRREQAKHDIERLFNMPPTPYWLNYWQTSCK